MVRAPRSTNATSSSLISSSLGWGTSTESAKRTYVISQAPKSRLGDKKDCGRTPRLAYPQDMPHRGSEKSSRTSLNPLLNSPDESRASPAQDAARDDGGRRACLGWRNERGGSLTIRR